MFETVLFSFAMWSLPHASVSPSLPPTKRATVSMVLTDSESSGHNSVTLPGWDAQSAWSCAPPWSSGLLFSRNKTLFSASTSISLSLSPSRARTHTNRNTRRQLRVAAAAVTHLRPGWKSMAELEPQPPPLYLVLMVPRGSALVS